MEPIDVNDSLNEGLTEAEARRRFDPLPAEMSEHLIRPTHFHPVLLLHRHLL